MAIILTREQIYDQYPDHWVLLDHTEIDGSQKLLSGHVLIASPDRDEVYRKAVELKPKRFAIVCTGKIPPNVAVIL